MRARNQMTQLSRPRTHEGGTEDAIAGLRRGEEMKVR